MQCPEYRDMHVYDDLEILTRSMLITVSKALGDAASICIQNGNGASQPRVCHHSQANKETSKT